MNAQAQAADSCFPISEGKEEPELGWPGPAQALRGLSCYIDLGPSWAEIPAATTPARCVSAWSRDLCSRCGLKAADRRLLLQDQIFQRGDRPLPSYSEKKKKMHIFKSIRDELLF